MSVVSRVLASTALALGIGLTLVIGWAVREGRATRAGRLSFRFVSASNDASGALLAQFKITSTCSRRVQLGVEEVQLFQSNTWPNWIRNPGGSNWFSVAPGSFLVVSAPVPTNAGVVWRVPLIFVEDQPVPEQILDKAQGLIRYGIARVVGPPFQGFRPPRWSLMFGPELPCLSNHLAIDAVRKLNMETEASRP